MAGRRHWCRRRGFWDSLERETSAREKERERERERDAHAHRQRPVEVAILAAPHVL